MLWDGRERVNRVGTQRSFGVRFTTRGHLSLTVAWPPSMQMTALVRFLVRWPFGQRRRDFGKCDSVSHALPSHAPTRYSLSFGVLKRVGPEFLFAQTLFYFNTQHFFLNLFVILIHFKYFFSSLLSINFLIAKSYFFNLLKKLNYYIFYIYSFFKKRK